MFSIEDRARELQKVQDRDNYVRVGKMFTTVFVMQWIAAVSFALFHSDLSAAVVLGGLLTSLPCFMIWRFPERKSTRVVVTIAQSLYSILLIRLSGGRIETHFHIFGSLAILSFYLDVDLIYLMTVITAADHLLRGIYWPESVYGVLSATPWRALEHSFWVLFEDVFLILSVRGRIQDNFDRALKEVQLQKALTNVEQQIIDRTLELVQSRQQLAVAAKMSALGEMAGGVAHEINTPLASIFLNLDQIHVTMERPDFKKEELIPIVAAVQRTTDRIAKIVKGLRSFSRDGSKDQLEPVAVKRLVDDTLDLCGERFKSKGVTLTVDPIPEREIPGQLTQLSQVLLNLLNNSFDAVENLRERWIRIGFEQGDGTFLIHVTDSGPGIPDGVRAKLFQPFFTTKGVGKGTGLGLSICKGIMESHGGDIDIKTHEGHTRFVMSIPAPAGTKAA